MSAAATTNATTDRKINAASLDEARDFALDAARAFNRGSDARLAGRSIGANPYRGDGFYADSWRRGWQDVDRYWGSWVERRWPVRPLPVVAAAGG
jgi:hypothetical protein